MSYVPVIIPVVGAQESKCPKCGREENIKKVCGYCGYEYKPGDIPWWQWVIVITIITIIVFLITYGITAIARLSFYETMCLSEIIRDDYREFVSVLQRLVR